MKMNWTGTHYQFFVELGASETVSFRISQDGDTRQSFYPSIFDACMADKYTICGPGLPETDFYWTIGKEDWNGRKDGATSGKRYEIRVKVEASRDSAPTQ